MRKGLFTLKHECKIIKLKIVLFIVKIIGINLGRNKWLGSVARLICGFEF